MKRVFSATFRLDLDNADEHRAWERLRQMDKRQFTSYGKLITAAVNEYYDRRERLTADPYLETREKEDASRQAVQQAIERGLRAQPTVLRTSPADAPVLENDSEDISAALDFADSF